jgi:hypothetical protein
MNEIKLLFFTNNCSLATPILAQDEGQRGKELNVLPVICLRTKGPDTLNLGNKESVLSEHFEK